MTGVAAERISDRVAKVAVEAKLPAGYIKFFATYTVYGSGDIVVNRLVPSPLDSRLPELPRLGMTMTLPREFDRIAWFGRGPQESYWDRKTGAAVGRYSGTVDEQYTPYIRPQENGNKTDVRYVVLTNEDGVGLIAATLLRWTSIGSRWASAATTAGARGRIRSTCCPCRNTRTVSACH